MINFSSAVPSQPTSLLEHGEKSAFFKILFVLISLLYIVHESMWVGLSVFLFGISISALFSLFSAILEMLLHTEPFTLLLLYTG